MSQQQQQQVVRQQSSSVTQQSSSSSSVQQQTVMQQQQQQSQVQTRVVREVRQGAQMVQGPTQVIQMGLPAGASPPVFEQIFRNARFAQGGDALFEGKVTGSPRPEVTWMRKGQQLQMGGKYQVTHNQNTGEVTLRIAAIGPGDEGEYTCTASNQYGEAICTVYIQPEAALMMQQQRQQQQSIQQKQTFMQQQTIQQQQQTSMQNGQMQSFRVDTFEYRLLNEVEFRQAITQRVANEQDMDFSGPVQGIPQAPQLQQKPRATKVAQGNSATFTAIVSANPSPRVTWFRNGERLRQNDKYQMSQSGNQVTLVVRNVSPADNGHYTLLAENPSGATVSSAQLACVPRSDDIVNGIQEVRTETFESQQQVETEESSKAMAPKFVKGPGDQVVQEGRMVRFDCRASGRPYPEVTWLLNGVVVSNDSRHKILVNEQGNHSLMITEASVQDTGVLSCIARNKTGEATAQCNLSVIEKEQVVAPKFVERFQQGQVNEGETLVLQVRAVGTPTPQLSWQKDGVSVMPSDSVQILTDGGSSTLQLLSSSMADSGWYQCTAQNTAGSTATRARLHVLSEKAAPQQPQRPYFPKPVKVIEPEKDPEPEIIYLRHVERAHHQVKSEEDEGPTEPPRFTHPLRDLDIVEGSRAHFEATVTPVGDATMQVEWLCNGQPIPASSRATATYRFGYVALDILSVTKADIGVYSCRVVNILGQDEVTAQLNVRERPQIESSSQHPEAMQQISYLEDSSRYQRTSSIDEQSNIKPTFVKPLVNLGDVQEGKYAHFEAQLHPVSDPFMKIDWFKDGMPITASSRINVIYNFGYVALNIMHLRAEDSGVYTVRAINRMGDASCQSTINVIAFGSVTGDLGIPEQAQYIRSVEEMEAYRLQMQQRSQQELLEASTAPVFKSEPKDTTSREGGYAHFEARLEPIGDPTLKIEWLKDGRAMEASSRITSFFNFGYVALTIKALVLQDQGTYTCRAYNSKGEAQVACVLTMLSKTDDVESQYEQTAMKMKFLEDAAKYKRTETEETTVSTMPPKFLGPLKGTNKILEGQKAHFEVRLEPQSDSSMVIEWYFNGQVIMSANRIKFYNDFGYVALDISDVRNSDAGTYTVLARNSLGQEQASTSMVVETRSSIDYSSMHEVTLDKTRAMERRHQEPQYDIEEISKSKPIFTQTLVDLKPIAEGKNIHMETRLEPIGDPTMKVEWFLNGKSVTIGSRFKTYFDFGYVALDVIGAYAVDSGEYTCRATNHLGSAHTSSCVQVVATGDIQTDSMHDDAMEQINFLEHGRQQRTATEETDINQPPNFTKSLKNIETFEGTNVHLEARLQPVGDSSMRIDWFFNDEPLKVGHRFRPAYDFDYVALDLLSVYPADSGIYSCRATNKLGQAVTSASVKVTAKKDLIFDSEHPESLHKLQYFDDASRYHRREIMEEVSVKIKPKFLTQLKELVLNEGQTAHFEAKLEPITDPNMKVEWYKDGRPLAEGSRFRYIHDFGYVALDIRGLVAADAGTYTCVATNLLGRDEITTTIKIMQSSNIVMESQNETLSMQQLKMLEDKSRYMRSEQVEETTKQAPVFTTSLKNVEIVEGQRAHFEARLIPASDPTMKVEWFHNGVVLKSGSRFMEYNDFGYVALDIMYCYAEDSGTYTCRATNAIGQAITECTMTCHSKDSIVLDTMNQEAMSKINRLETRTTRTTITEDFTSQAPVFTNPLKDRALAENAPLHFEARLIPVGDPDLKVEWFKNGVPLQQANRISTMHDFGYVALDMKYVNPEDSGTYTCRATNRLGQAVTSASLVVTSKEALLLDSEHGDALHKLRMLEDTSRYTKTTIEETVITQAPTFVVKLSGLTNLWEGQSAHVECRLEPYPDPSMKVEWFHNGKPLSAGSRFRTIYDFGFCALDLLQVVAEDTGTYEVRATNKIGTASSMIEITVKPKSDFIVDTVHPDALPKLARLEQKAGYKVSEEQVVIEKPNFGRSLRNQDRLVEGQAVHMEATLTPVNDPTMKVEWFFNGSPIPSGHRFRTTYDFGFVALDILYAYPEDCGTYMCRATNAAGQAVTSCSINVEATGSMLTDTLDEQRMKKIKLLEHSDMRRDEMTADQVFQKPVFTTALQNVEGISEGERVHLECRLEPVNDPNLKVEWFVNGVEIKAGHRFRTTHDFGYVALDVLYSYAEDSGTYLCRATNKLGEAVNSCSVSVTAHRSIYMDTQHPMGWEKIQNLEQRGRYERLEVADLPNQPPRFTSELRGITTLAEGQRAHMEGRIEPIHDPSMRIEWYHNGKILQSAARFHTTFDFGYVALDISSVYEEDSGVYTCRVFNNMGEATSSITFKIEGKSSIIYESARPEGLEKIREMEDHARGQRKAAEEVRTFQRPVFTQPLQNLDAFAEGETAHFECRLIPVGDPRLKVEWYRNEVLIETSSRINCTHDFGYVSLDISGVRGDDDGIYMCRAHNDLGEAVTTASMKIKTHGTIQFDTHHPEGMRKIAALESRKTSDKGPEADKVYDKPVFTTNLTGPAQLMEGQRAHYECRVVPIGDPTMQYEWYCNGVNLKMGSRFQTSHDFGFVTLNILQVIPEDSGVYMCKAFNRSGEAVSSCTTRVIGRDSIIGDAAHPEGWEKIRLREAQWNRVPQAPTTPDAQEPPMFTKNLESHDKLMEGGTVHLEAQVQPAHDPHLSIEWFKNGMQLATGTRIRSTFDFGHVTLDISGLRESDCGIYTCKAVNRVGEAVSTCNLKVYDRDWLIGDTVHPDALPKLARLEQPRQSAKSPDDPTYDIPMFITHLNNVECNESETAHFECRVEPSKDPTMKIEWFINGKPMQAASRYHATYDFGFIALDCTHCYAEDSGVYMCRATNCKGSATTTGTLKCISKANLYFDTQHPQGQAGLEKVEEAERAFWSKYQRQESEKEISYPKPVFIRPLQTNFMIVENQLLHMEANVEPKNDPNLRIEWFLNGKPLEEASRFKTSYDFGLVTLDLKDCNERDQGIYTCRAYNKVGEAFCTSTVVVTSKDSLIEGTQHPAGETGLEAILRMEESLRRHDRMLPDEEGHPPVFTTVFKSLSNVEEGEIAHFEAMLTPVGDQTMRVEWFYKGEALKASSRVRTVYAFGMVVLEIVGSKIADSGEYTCKAHNKWGKAECSLTLEVVDRAHGQPPKFTTHIESLDNLKDGASAHFECTLIPIGDPNMKVEWFHNDQPIRNATRIKTVSDFGFVVLDIAYLRDHDSGEWVCKASNKYGEDYTRGTINYRGKGGVYTDSLQPQSLDRIAELEAGKMKSSTPLSPAAAEPPCFITHITNIEHLVEGQSAHFEARLKPVGDPNLTVEWYKDGKKLPSGHRYRTFHDFGIVILDILYCYEEDSGVYEARAVNKLGEDKTTANLKCSSKTGLILTPQVPRGMEGGLDKIQHMEDTAWMRKDTVTSDKVGMAPKFTVPLTNIDNLKEGENAHFEARIVPTDDPRLKVEWYWNGKPMKHSSRIRQFCDFGFVIMELSPVYPEDSGEYMCRAYNDYGEAVTKATLKCDGKRSIILESQLPKSMQRGMEKIAELEGLMIKSPDMPTPSDVGQAPQFITEPKDVTILENQLAHFECRLLPVGDPNLRVDWYHNGKTLGAGTRIKTINDFGYVILEMSGCYGRDSGTYVCRAVNKHGEASVQCNLEVTSKSGINFEPQATSQFKDCTESIQKLEQSMWKKEDLKFDEEKGSPPRFVTNLENVDDLVEGQPAHFDCRVEPVGDPSMRIEWFHNGIPLAAGSRMHMMDDFGFVVLDLEWTFARDSGEYLCRATNKYGQATTTASLHVRSKHGVDLNSQLPKGMTAEKLKELERGPLTEKYDPDADLTPPKFVVHIKDAKLEEGESAFFEARVEPRHDPNLRIEWYFNGKPLQSGHRFRTSFEMGHVTLTLLHTYAEDSGEYVCRAVNKLGQDITKATLKSRAAQSVVMQSQVPKGMKRMDFATQMEETLKKYCKEVFLTQEDIYEPEKRQPPRFVTQIKDMMELQEMQEAKFECQLAPVGDPNMKVEWFFNGRPLPYKNRFTPIYDFGYVAMIMGWVFAEDSGEYLCRATNLYGMDETRAVIKSTSRPGVIYDSQIPKGMQSLEKIRELESSWQIHPEKFLEEEKVRAKPEILRPPVSLLVQEGEWARFSVRISGHPKPRVMWMVNGSTAMSGNRFKIWYDGMFHLDIPKTRQYDNGKVEVIARNALGEAYATCELKVNPRQDDYRAVLKNSPKQHNESSSSYRKPDWVTRMEELKTTMQAEHVEPQFLQELEDGKVKEMENYVFTVTFAGNPKPELSWYHDNLLLHQQQCFQMRVRGDKAFLSIVEASPKHRGEYVCRAVNSAGEAFTKATLDVIELTYEEKLKIDNERYAALSIQHAAEHMKVKERERSEREKIAHKEAMEKMREERHRSIIEKERELEEAKLNTWKPQRRVSEVVVKKVEPQTPKEHRIAQVYTNWKAPVALEEAYPEIEPEEFSPNQIPGVKCFVKVSDTSIRGEEVVNEIAPRFFEDEQVVIELAKVHTLLRNSVRVNEIWSMFRAGDFPALQQPSIQTALVKICEYIGHQRNVSIVLAEETRIQSAQHPVGLKAFLRMLKHANNVKHDVLFKEVIPKEMGKWSSTTQELEKVSQMLNQGIQTEEIIASCEAGHLPTLKKPETQQPLVNIVEKQGHSVMVAQVLVEEAYRDAKDDRVLAEHAWQVLHEEELTHAAVLQVKEDSLVVDKATHTSQFVTQETQQTLIIDEQQELETRELLPYRTQPLAQPRTEKQITTKIAETQPLDTFETQQDVDYDEYSTEEQIVTEQQTMATNIVQTKDVTTEQPQPVKRQVRRVQKKIIRRPKSVEKVALKPVDATRTVSEVETEHVTLKPVTKVQSEESVLQITDRDASAKLVSSQMFYEQSDHTQLDIGSDTQLSTLQKLQDISDSKLIRTEEEEEESRIKLIKPKPITLETSKTTENITKLEKVSVKPKPQTQLVETEQVTLKPVVQKTSRVSEKQQLEHVDLKPTQPKEIKQETLSEPVQLKPLVKTDVVKVPKPKPVDLKPLTKVTSTEPIPEAAKVTLRPTIAESPVVEPQPEEVTLEPMTLVEPEPAPQPETVTLTPLVKQEVAPGSPGTKRKIIRKKVIVKKSKPELEQAPEQIKFKSPKQRELRPDDEAEQVILKPFTIPSQPAPEPEQPVKQVEEPLPKLKPVVIPEREEVILEAYKPTPIKELPLEEPKPEPVQLKPIPKPSPIEPIAEPEPVKRKPVQKQQKEEPQPEPVQFKVKQRPAKPEPEPEEVRLKPIPKAPKPEPETAAVELKPIQKPVPLEPIPEPEAPKLKKVKKVIKPKPEPEPEEVSLKPVKRLVKDEPEPEPIQLKPIEKKEKPEPEPEVLKLKPVQKPAKVEPEPETIKLKPRQKPAEPEPAPEPIKLKPIPKPSKPEPEPEPIKLKPIQKPIEPVPDREPVQLKPIPKPDVPEPKPEPVQLQPIEKPVKPTPEPEPVVLKPIPKAEKPKPEPEPEPEPVKFKRVQKPAEPEPEPEPIKLKPIQKPAKPESEPEPIKLKPIQKPDKPLPEPEAIKLKPVQKPTKPEPEPEPIKLKPVQKPTKPELEPEPIKLKPVQKPAKPEPEPEPIKLKPVQKPTKPEPEPEPIKLKPVQKPAKPEPEPEPIQLKPIQKPAKPELEPEPIMLKPVKKTEKPLPEPEPVSLKPALKPVKEKEVEPEAPKLKPRKPLKPKPEPEPEKITLKPVQKPSKPEPVPQPVTPKIEPGKPDTYEPETEQIPPSSIVEQFEEVVKETEQITPKPHVIDDTETVTTTVTEVRKIEYEPLQPILTHKESYTDEIILQTTPQAQTEIKEITIVSETKPEEPKVVVQQSEEVLVEQTVPASTFRFEEDTAKQVIQQDFYQTTQQSHHVQMVQESSSQMQFQNVEEQQIIKPMTEQVQQTIIEETPKPRIDVSQTVVKISPQPTPVFEKESGFVERKVSTQDVTVTSEERQYEQVDVQQPQVMMREKQTITTMQPEVVQTVTQQVVTRQAKTAQQEQTMESVTVQQTKVTQEATKSPTVVRKVKKIIKKPKKETTVTVQEVQEIPEVEDVTIIKKTVLEQPEVVVRKQEIIIESDAQVSLQQQQVVQQRVEQQQHTIVQQQVQQKVEQKQQVVQEKVVQQQQQVSSQKEERRVVQEEVIQEVTRLPKVDVAAVSSVPSLKTASSAQVVVKEDTQMNVSSTITIEAVSAQDVKVGDQLRAIATYVAEEEHENSMHLVEGERVYVLESINSDWWFVEKHLTKERGYVPAKLLAVDASYTLYVKRKLEEKIDKLNVFEKLKKGQKGEAPKISQMLESQTIVDGQEVQFVVKVDGTPRPNVTWFRQTAIIKPSEEFQVFYSEDNTATLLIKEVFPEDAGLFTCVVKNIAGYAVSEAELIVEGPVSDHGSETMVASRRSLSRDSSVCDVMEGIPPTFAMKSISKTCEENAQFEVDVRLVAIPEPEIVWKKEGLILRDSNRIRIVRQKDVHAYRSMILIKGTKKDDEGEYVVHCKNREGEAKCNIFLKITAPEAPLFEELFSDTTVEEDGTIRLVARIRGVPTPDISWSRNGKKLKLEKNVIARYEEETAVLEVQHASSKTDAGKYVCTATNKVGKASHSANVTVGSDVVTFKRGLESCVVEENAEAILECRTSKEKEVKWWKGKTQIKSSERILIEHEGLTHRIVIHSAAVSDTGKYKCTFDDQSTWCNFTVKPLEEFIQKLQDFEVLEKDEAVFYVEVSTEKAVITWHKEGEEITGDDRVKVEVDGKIRRLVISSTNLHDEGEYTCVLGDLESTCELTVRELPAEIVKDMEDQTVNKAEKASFAVELSKGDAVVTWFKDGQEIRFSDHYQLSIDGKVQRLLIYNCQTEDIGVYRAVVGKTECSARLEVEAQAEGDFSKKLPSQMDVISSTDAEFTVEITKADRDVKWFRNGEEVSASARFIIKKKKNVRTLTIKSVTIEDTAEYTCVLGSLKTSCKMNVLVLESAPQVDRSSIQTEFVVIKGTEVTFTVPFKATPQPTATWSHKGKEIKQSKRLMPTISENVASFTIYQVENVDCGEYSLKLANSCGDVTIDFVLKILDKPSKPGAPEPLRVTNDSVTLLWRAPEDDGGRIIINYIIEYTFRKETKWVVYNSSETISDTTVTVTRLTKNEEYSFRVAAVNEVGTSEYSEQSEYIKVAEPIRPEAPMVKEFLEPVVTGLRQLVVLRCVITGTPVPDITWTKDERVITSNITYENYTATLTIKETDSTTSGLYTCKASNSAGTAETSATVVIQEAPQFEFDEKSQAQRLFVGERWHVPIKVTGFPQPKISWTCNDQPIQNFPRVVVHIEESEGLTDIAIQKLAFEDSAVFAITAQNSGGKATISFNLRVDEEEIIVKEVEKERPAAPAGPLDITDITTCSARLTWRPSPHDGGSEITSYYIEKLEKGQKQWHKVAEVEPNVFSYVVESLNEGREYFFRVFALNAIGLSEALEASETIFIKSPFNPPGPPLGPFDVSDMAETSLVLHWDEPLEDGGSPITGYTIERRTAMKKAWQKIGQTEGDVTKFECTNLKKGYTYFFRVFAVNVAGQGPPLQPDEAITAGKKLSVPSKPNGLTVMDVTSKTVTLGWSPPSTTGGADLIGYVIEKRLTIESASWEKVQTVDSSVTLFCVENLLEKSEYEFRVFAENPVGISEEAAITEYVLLKTHATPPSPPTAPLEARPTGPTSLMIEWGCPESDGGSPLLGYIIAIRDIKRTMWIEVGQVDANFTRLHIKEVQEEHEYNVRVFARNEIGASEPLQTEDPVKIIRPDDFQEVPEEDAAPSLSYSTTETLSWMREAGVDADIYSYARGRLLNRDEYFFKVWHQTQQIRQEEEERSGGGDK